MTFLSRSFTTANIPAHATLSAWRDYMAEVYYSVDVKPRDGSVVRGELRESTLGMIGISKFCADQQRVFRYAQAAQHDRAENFVFIFPLKEQLYFDQRGRSGFIHPGGVALLNSSEYYEASCPDGFENLTLKIPCAELRKRLPGIDSLCARTGIANSTLTLAVSHMSLPLLDPAEPWTASQEAQLSDHLLDLVQLMIESAPGFDGNDYRQLGRANAMLRQITAFMRQNLGDHELSPSHVATAHDISLRYVHKLFAQSGTTFGHVLMGMRVQEARRLIESSARRDTTLQQIAFSCGFTSQSHFSTSYKAHFGVSPRVFRSRTMDG